MFLAKNRGRAVWIPSKQIGRQIFKTTSVTYSDFITPHLDTGNTNVVCVEKQVNFNLEKCNRLLSTLNSNELSRREPEDAVSKNLRRDFIAIFPDFLRDLTGNMKHIDVETSKWLAKVLQYNVPGGKMIRGLMTVSSYKLLEKPENLTPENIHLINIMDWCVEMIQAASFVLDDLMDRSTMRRSVPCWHTKSGIGVLAINDSLLIQASLYFALKKNFQDKTYYKNVLDMVNEILFKTAIGEYLDMATSKADKADLSKFTMDRYNATTKYKTSYYTFQLPVGLSMLMCGIDDPETHRQAKTIFFEIGKFFQIQDDFLDCFGNPTVTGKISTDIQEGKCTWLSVVALQRANPAQKLLMEEYYGSHDPEHVAKIKALYEELGIPHTYTIYEEMSYNSIRTQIQQITRNLPHELFSPLLEKIYRRHT